MGHTPLQIKYSLPITKSVDSPIPSPLDHRIATFLAICQMEWAEILLKDSPNDKRIPQDQDQHMA